jgi:hypothetical protein
MYININECLLSFPFYWMRMCGVMCYVIWAGNLDLNFEFDLSFYKLYVVYTSSSSCIGNKKYISSPLQST